MWVRKAEQDFTLVKKIENDRLKLHDALCFHCQQCVEKYLKALLVETGLTVPRTHDLDRLLMLLLPLHQSLATHRRGLLVLSSFAVETRYPGFDASKRQAASSLRWADKIRQECRTILKIKPKRTGHKTP